MWKGTIEHMSSICDVGRKNEEEKIRRVRERKMENEKMCSEASSGLMRVLQTMQISDLNSKTCRFFSGSGNVGREFTLYDFTQCENFSKMSKEMKENGICVDIERGWGDPLSQCNVRVKSNGLKITSIVFDVPKCFHPETWNDNSPSYLFK